MESRSLESCENPRWNVQQIPFFRSMTSSTCFPRGNLSKHSRIILQHLALHCTHMQGERETEGPIQTNVNGTMMSSSSLSVLHGRMVTATRRQWLVLAMMAICLVVVQASNYGNANSNPWVPNQYSADTGMPNNRRPPPPSGRYGQPTPSRPFHVEQDKNNNNNDDDESNVGEEEEQQQDQETSRDGYHYNRGNNDYGQPRGYGTPNDDDNNNNNMGNGYSYGQRKPSPPSNTSEQWWQSSSSSSSAATTSSTTATKYRELLKLKQSLEKISAFILILINGIKRYLVIEKNSIAMN